MEAPTPTTKAKVSCTTTDCAAGLHCFRRTQALVKANQVGVCRECGANLVDWPRVHVQDLADVEYTFQALKFEYIRHYFWEQPFDPAALATAQRKGLVRLCEDVPNRIRQAIGSAKPFHDGYQTPYEKNVIFYAQHATASCCRKCAEYWHDIPQGRDLTDAEVDYLSKLAIRYLEERLAEFQATPEESGRDLKMGATAPSP